MTDDKPDYAAIIKGRKPLPTIDLEDLRQRSAEATKTTVVLQPTSERHGTRTGPDVDRWPTAPATVAPTKARTRKSESAAPEPIRVPLRFSVSMHEQHELRIQAALENRSVPDLMRAIITAYLRIQGRIR